MVKLIMDTIESLVRNIVRDELSKIWPPAAQPRVENVADAANRVYSVARVADLLGVSVDYIYARIRSGEIETIELGGGRAKQRVTGAELQRFVESRRYIA